MKKVDFLFGVHNHQPVGNFDHVFDESFRKCYLPFLKVLKDHPGIRISLHTSGPLWDYSMEKIPEYIELVKELTDRNQIELLGGGYYEPLLPIIPERDAVGQVEMMKSFLKDRFGFNSKGIWLTERVWEPQLPYTLGGIIDYTIIDDSHFRLAGITDNHIKGHYITEKWGRSTAIFPISKLLRYYIPFKLPHETINLLKEVSEQTPATLTYADDGEKFGIWPETYKWVYEERWLHRFFEEIENNLSWINMPTFSEYIENRDPVGRIYLPTASYAEMMEWALPYEAAINYKRVSQEIGNMGKTEDFGTFLRGGIWSNFLAKYPEANHMYQKMLSVSSRLNGIISGTNSKENEDLKKIESIKKSLYKAQCNCAYWHGLFGGLYLNYLRHAIYENLILAEKMCDEIEHSGHKSWCETSRFNFYDSKEDEIIINSKNLGIVISPKFGASIAEIDYKPKSFNISNVMKRSKESYHDKIKRMEQKTAELFADSPKSIHDIQDIKDKNIVEKLIYDNYPKFSFIEHFLAPLTKMSDFVTGKHTELACAGNLPYQIDSLSINEKQKTHVSRFSKELTLGEHEFVKVIKEYKIRSRDSLINASFDITNKSENMIKCLFAVELNLTLLAGNDDKRYYLIGESEKHNLSAILEKKADSIILADEWNTFKVELKSDKNSAAWLFPVETVSQSESGFELTYQGSTVVFSNILNLKPGNNKTFLINLKIGQI